MNRQRLILFVLLIVLALSVSWSFYAMPRPVVAPSRTSELAPRFTTSGRSLSGPASASSLPRDPRILELDLLNHELKSFSGYRRNLFRPFLVDERKIVQKKAVALKPVAAPPKPPPPPPPVVSVSEAELRAQRNRQELAKFVFKGFLNEDKRKTIFLIKDGTILLVKKGDVLENRFQATSITDQALTIKAVDSSEDIVIPLTENLPLRAAP